MGQGYKPRWLISSCTSGSKTCTTIKGLSSMLQRTFSADTNKLASFSQQALYSDAQSDNMEERIKESVFIGNDAIDPHISSSRLLNFSYRVAVQKAFFTKLGYRPKDSLFEQSTVQLSKLSTRVRVPCLQQLP